MAVYSGIAEAADAARRAVIMGATGLAEAVIEKLLPMTRTGGSPVDLIVGFAEAVYANREDASADAKDIAIGCALECEQRGFHGMAIDSRSSRIADVLGEVEGVEAPEPKAEWLPDAES